MKMGSAFMQGLGITVGIGILLGASPQISGERVLGEGVSTGVMDGSKTLVVLGDENTMASLSADEVTTSLLLMQRANHPKLAGCTISTGISPDGVTQIIEWPNGDYIQKVLLWMSLFDQLDDKVNWSYYRNGQVVETNKDKIRQLNSIRLREIEERAK